MDTQKCPQCGACIGEDEIQCPFCNEDLYQDDGSRLLIIEGVDKLAGHKGVWLLGTIDGDDEPAAAKLSGKLQFGVRENGLKRSFLVQANPNSIWVRPVPACAHKKSCQCGRLLVSVDLGELRSWEAKAKSLYDQSNPFPPVEPDFWN